MRINNIKILNRIIIIWLMIVLILKKYKINCEKNIRDIDKEKIMNLLNNFIKK